MPRKTDGTWYRWKPTWKTVSGKNIRTKLRPIDNGKVFLSDDAKDAMAGNRELIAKLGLYPNTDVLALSGSPIYLSEALKVANALGFSIAENLSYKTFRR